MVSTKKTSKKIKSLFTKKSSKSAKHTLEAKPEVTDAAPVRAEDVAEDLVADLSPQESREEEVAESKEAEGEKEDAIILDATDEKKEDAIIPDATDEKKEEEPSEEVKEDPSAEEEEGREEAPEPDAIVEDKEIKDSGDNSHWQKNCFAQSVDLNMCTLQDLGASATASTAACVGAFTEMMHNPFSGADEPAAAADTREAEDEEEKKEREGGPINETASF